MVRIPAFTAILIMVFRCNCSLGFLESIVSAEIIYQVGGGKGLKIIRPKGTRR